MTSSVFFWIYLYFYIHAFVCCSVLWGCNNLILFDAVGFFKHIFHIYLSAGRMEPSHKDW